MLHNDRVQCSGSERERRDSRGVVFYSKFKGCSSRSQTYSPSPSSSSNHYLQLQLCFVFALAAAANNNNKKIGAGSLDVLTAAAAAVAAAALTSFAAIAATASAVYSRQHFIVCLYRSVAFVSLLTFSSFFFAKKQISVTLLFFSYLLPLCRILLTSPSSTL